MGISGDVFDGPMKYGSFFTKHTKLLNLSKPVQVEDFSETLEDFDDFDELCPAAAALQATTDMVLEFLTNFSNYTEFLLSLSH